MKRSPMPPLRKPLARVAPMPRAAAQAPRSRPRDTGPDAATRSAVYEREVMRCAICGDADGPMAVHHRRPRGAGGTRRESANLLGSLLLLCEGCHLHVESHRTDALDNGWLVGQHVEDPSSCPLVYRLGRSGHGGRTVLLGNDGSVTDVPSW